MPRALVNGVELDFETHGPEQGEPLLLVMGLAMQRVAWPVALLSALRYLLAPLSLWSGHRSDSRLLWGTRRVGYIWLGRALMLLSLPLLPWSTVQLAGEPGSAGGWVPSAVRPCSPTPAPARKPGPRPEGQPGSTRRTRDSAARAASSPSGG